MKLLVMACLLLAACQSKKPAAITTTRLDLDDDNTPTVSMPFIHLVGNGSPEQEAAAREIMRVKRKWPLAMQSKQPAAFDSILSVNFSFVGGPNLMSREAYIADRTSPSDWRITMVHYENMVLQFFDDHALLTYKNRVRNENTAGEVEYDVLSWADVFSKIKGKWMISSSHVVDFRMEK